VLGLLRIDCVQGITIQQGTTSIIFYDSTYTQVGKIETPSAIDFSDEGTYSVSDKYLHFNTGREILMSVFPDWSLIGYFNYESNDSAIFLSQGVDNWHYEIEMHKSN